MHQRWRAIVKRTAQASRVENADKSFPGCCGVAVVAGPKTAIAGDALQRGVKAIAVDALGGGGSYCRTGGRNYDGYGTVHGGGVRVAAVCFAAAAVCFV